MTGSAEVSKRLSYVLRHRPDSVGIVLDAAGWVDVGRLLAALARDGLDLDRAQLEEVVAGNDKRRFAFSKDGTLIRASQGHSVSVELGYQPAQPPARLYHGTVGRFLDAIRRDGLCRGSRHHVHLSQEPTTASVVGARRGQAVVLVVLAREMAQAGHLFWRTANGVWLAEAVPPRFLAFPSAPAVPPS